MTTKFVYISLCSLFVLVNCNTEGNKGVLKNETTEESVTYKGMDGSRAKITFENSDSGNTITIIANGKKFQLDKKQENFYERNGVSVEIKGDSATIHQGENVIPLVKDL